MSQVSKSRDWVFTINNYTQDTIEHLDKFNPSWEYIIYGKEVASTGTRHLQGFIQLRNPTSLQEVKRQLGSSPHLERRRGSVQQAMDYCKKDGDYYESGSATRLQTSKEAQQAKWKNIITLAESSELTIIKEEYPSEYLRYYRTILSLQSGDKTILKDLTNEWWWGPTGTGKSYTLWKDYPDHFQKELNKWWDNYRGQEVVAIEEWCPKNECTASQLKIWADRYPFTAQIKGGSLPRIRPKKIIILSNYTIDQCFSNPEDREPIKRRFKEVHYPFTFIPREDINLNLDFLDNIPN
uniref:Replication-associated protein n=1 Tax=Red panda feces-associated circular DNA virus 20 TaxID=2863974 RepID=A0A8K1HKD9_9VIRU|nr:putative replication-associated protein [Red panda feces-associated circular DNA virus 20]